MNSIPQRPRRHSTVRVTAVDGTVWEGTGEGLALAMRDLGRKHRAGEPAADQGHQRSQEEPGAEGEASWKPTAAGEAYLAGWRERGAADGAAR